MFHVMIVFVIIILLSFIPEQFSSFFGDWKCAGSGEVLSRGEYIHYSNCDSGGFHLAVTHWGFRHWLWLAMGLIIFVIQIFRIVSIFKDKEL